jgi:transposase
MVEINDNNSLILVFQDEVHFMVQATITAGWFKKGSRPKVKSFPGKDKVAYSGFVIPEDGRLFVCKPDWFNTKSTIASLREFLAVCPPPEGKKYAIVMDNASWHRAAQKAIGEGSLRHPAYYDISDYVVFIKMPPYSPDFNPIEQVWRITRRENTHNRFFEGKSELEAIVDSAFAAWMKPNEQLRSLCSFNWLM